MFTLEELQAFHLLRHYLYPNSSAEEKAKEAGDYVIDLARKIKKSRETGPWITSPCNHKDLSKEL